MTNDSKVLRVFIVPQRLTLVRNAKNRYHVWFTSFDCYIFLGFDQQKDVFGQYLIKTATVMRNQIYPWGETLGHIRVDTGFCYLYKALVECAMCRL